MTDYSIFQPLLSHGTFFLHLKKKKSQHTNRKYYKMTLFSLVMVYCIQSMWDMGLFSSYPGRNRRWKIGFHSFWSTVAPQWNFITFIDQWSKIGWFFTARLTLSHGTLTCGSTVVEKIPTCCQCHFKISILNTNLHISYRHLGRHIKRTSSFFGSALRNYYWNSPRTGINWRCVNSRFFGLVSFFCWLWKKQKSSQRKKLNFYICKICHSDFDLWLNEQMSDFMATCPSNEKCDFWILEWRQFFNRRQDLLLAHINLSFTRSQTGFQGMFVHVRATRHSEVAQFGALRWRQEPNARFSM